MGSLADRDAEWEALYRSGLCYREIGERYGLSREAVRLRLPPWLIGWRTQRDAARRRLRRFEESHAVCRLCGVHGEFTAFCCPEHYQMWMTFRSHLPGEAEKHRRADAISVLRRPGASPADRRRAAAVLSDEPPPKNREYLQPGSQAHLVATLAYQQGWPVFDLLGQTVQDRVLFPNGTGVCETCAGPINLTRRHRERASRYCSWACYHQARRGASA